MTEPPFLPVQRELRAGLELIRAAEAHLARPEPDWSAARRALKMARAVLQAAAHGRGPAWLRWRCICGAQGALNALPAVAARDLELATRGAALAITLALTPWPNARDPVGAPAEDTR